MSDLTSIGGNPPIELSNLWILKGKDNIFEKWGEQNKYRNSILVQRILCGHSGKNEKMIAKYIQNN